MGKNTEVGSVSLGVKLSDSDLYKQSNSIGNKAGGMLAKSFNTGFSKIAIGLAAVFSTKQMISFTKECLDLGSDLSEVQNVVDTTFTTMNSELNTWAKNAMGNFGLSEKYAKQYASTLGTMSRSMGATEKVAYDMGTTIAGLAGDVASFYNLSADESYNKLKGIWTGETEGLKALGVVMTQTALDQYALNNGFGKTTAKMTEQEKLMLRYQYVTNALSAASGDFVKTQDSWANQTKVLSLRFESLKATLGQGFINVFTPVLRIINELVAKLQVLADRFSSLTENMFGKSEASSAFAGMASGADEVSSGIDNITSSAMAATRQLAGFDKITKLGDDSSSGSSTSTSEDSPSNSINLSVSTDGHSAKIDGILDDLKSSIKSFNKWCTANFASGIKTGITKVTKELKSGVKTANKVWSDIKSLADPLKKIFEKDGPKVINSFVDFSFNNLSRFLSLTNTIFGDLWSKAVMPILSKFVSKGIPAILQFTTLFTDLLDVIYEKGFSVLNTLWKDVFSPFCSDVAFMILNVMDILSDAWNKYGVSIFDKITEAVRNLSSTCSVIWENILKPIIDSAMDVVLELWNSSLKPLTKNAVDAFMEIGACLLDLWNTTLSPIVSWMAELFGPSIADSFKTIHNVSLVVFKSLTDSISTAITMLKGLVQFVTGVLTGDWSKAWTGIKNIFVSVFESLAVAIKTSINLIISSINGLLSGITTAANSIIKELNKVNVKIPDWIPEIGGKSFGISLKTFKTPSIPMLAEGAYVKPNTPQLAIIGDNKHQGEIVAPEDKLTEMAMAAVRAASGSDYSLEILAVLKEILAVLKALDLDIVIDGKKLKDIIVKKINQHTRATGVCEIII